MFFYSLNLIIKKINKLKIPVLIIVGLLLITGVGFLGLNQYKNYQIKKSEKVKLAQENQKLIEEKELQEKQSQNQEMEKLKKEIDELKNAPKTIIEENNPSAAKSQEISVQEINLYLTSITKISCKNQEGSGTLWQIGNDYYVLTNLHVVSKPYPYGSCNVIVHDRSGSNGIGFYTIYLSTSTRWNTYTDVSLLKISLVEDSAINSLSLPIQNLNYNVSFLRQCLSQMSLGSPVIIIGYPAFSLSPIQYQGEQLGEQTVRTITNGIISSYESSEVKPYGSLPYPNYFVSAKIDSGNSGGMAFSKDSKGLCILGIPTWLSVGNYETQGIIQNIHNIMYTGN